MEILELHERGFTDLVSVIPPAGQLVPDSTIDERDRGKVPGRMDVFGEWAGYDWRSHKPTIDELKRWQSCGSNLGLLGTHFPGIDIDVDVEPEACRIQEIAETVLGEAPVRVGRAPKTILDVPNR